MPRSPDPDREGALQPPVEARARTRAGGVRPVPTAGDRDLRKALHRIDLLVAQRTRLEQEVLSLREANARACHGAYHDELTGLPNRSLLQDRFTQALALATRQGRQVALVFLDLDAFKRVNDAFGHTVGDRLLQQVAARLSACIRASDTACRYGGDEFVVLLPDLEDAPSASAVAAKILTNLATPYCVEGQTIEMTTSLGIAFYPGDGTECGTLIGVADRAMYRNKSRDRADGQPGSDRRLPGAVDDTAAVTAARPAGAGEQPTCNPSGA